MAPSLFRISVFLHKHRIPVAVSCCGGVFAANMFLHVFPDQTYRVLYQAWLRGSPVELTEKLEGLFQQVLKDYGVGFTKNFSAFASSAFHPASVGVPWFPAGARIAIPFYFNTIPYEVSGITIDKDGPALGKDMLFSQDAQKFAIAREVARLQSDGPILKAAVAPLCLGGVWVYSSVLKQVFGLHGRPLLLRSVTTVAALGISAISYFLILGALSRWLDYSSDRRAASISREYAEGGLEFYNKVLSFNKALSLLEQKGEVKSAPLFLNYIFQLNHAPYTSRRDRILTLLKEKKT